MDFTNVSQNYEAGTKVLASQFVFGLSRKTQWLSGLYYTDFISFYSPTQLCGGGTTKSNSNELPISVPLSLLLLKNYLLMGETCHLLKSPCFVFNSCYNGTIKTLGKEFYES